MPADYPTQSGTYIIGNDETAATLTAAYTGNTFTVLSRAGSHIELNIAYTPAENGRILSLKVESGPEDDDLYYLTTTDLADGVGTIRLREPESFTGAASGTTYKFGRSYPVRNYRFRVSVKEDGSSNFGTVTVRYTMTSG